MEDGSPAEASGQTAPEAVMESEESVQSDRAHAEESLPVVAAGSASRGSSVARWMRVARAPLLTCSVGPVLVAGAVLWARGDSVSILVLGLSALAVGLTQAGAQVLDVYLEHVRALNLSGDPNSSVARMPNRPPSVLLAEGIYPLDAFRMAAGLFVAGAGLGIPLALTGGMPVVVVGGLGVVAAFLYSATTYALKRQPLGELVVLLALGPGIVTLATLAQRHPVTPLALALGAALGCFAFALVAASDLRALAPEIRSGRKTLVRLLGRTGGRRLFAGGLMAAYLVVVIAALQAGAPHGALAVLFSLPVTMLPLTGGLRAHSAATLDLVVTGTARAYGFFVFWLIVGLLLGGLFLRLVSVLGG